MWSWPRRVTGSAGLAKVFARKRRDGNDDGKHIRCQASEGLSLFAVLGYWVKTVVLPRQPDIAARCVAFLCLVEVLECLANVARGKVPPAELQRRVEAFLQAFARAWDMDLKPKFHWMHHYAQRLEQWGVLIACFVHERKHKLVRRYGNEVTDPRVYELSVVRELTAHHVAELSEAGALEHKVGLVNPRVAPNRLRNALGPELDLQAGDVLETSSELRYSVLGTVKVKDVVLIVFGSRRLPPARSGACSCCDVSPTTPTVFKACARNGSGGFAMEVGMRPAVLGRQCKLGEAPPTA